MKKLLTIVLAATSLSAVAAPDLDQGARFACKQKGQIAERIMEARQLGNDQNLVLSAFPAHSDLVQKAYSAPLEASMPNAAMTVARFGVQARNASMTSL